MFSVTCQEARAIRTNERMSSREAEFEGLLRANDSSTKVIFLGRNGPVKCDVTHSEGGPVGPSQRPRIKRTRPEISAPSFVTPREETTLRPSTPHAQPVACFRLPAGIALTPNA